MSTAKAQSIHEESIFPAPSCGFPQEHVTMLALSIVAFLLVPVAYYVGCPAWFDLSRTGSVGALW
eukprot:391081-Amphidinium_carterae.1